MKRLCKLFPCQEIGSLAKPSWRVKKRKGVPVTNEDLRQAEAWAARLGIGDIAALRESLCSDSPESVEKVAEWASLFALRLFEACGLDIVYNGEQTRSEMYQAAAEHIEGLAFYGEVRSFDNKYYLKGSAVAPLRLKAPYHVEEFRFVQSHTDRVVKVPVTGAYTLADWSFCEHYLKSALQTEKRYPRALERARRDLVLDLARQVLRPTLRALIRAGAEWIQIDEPAATTKPDEVALFVESFNESVQGLHAKFSCHICFSDYAALFPDALEMKQCSQFAWEFANRDDEKRAGYRDLHLFADYNDGREVGLGVTDVHRDFVEPPELVRDRILYAAGVLGDPARVYVNPDCGLRTRSWEVVEKKLRAQVAGAAMAREELDGAAKA